MNWWLIVDIIGWAVTFALALGLGLLMFHAVRRRK